jgi:hypothetical protein
MVIAASPPSMCCFSPEELPMTLQERVKQQLESVSHFRGRIRLFNFAFDEHASALTISGVVPYFYLKQLLQSALKDLEGVSRVINKVVVA